MTAWKEIFVKNRNTYQFFKVVQKVAKSGMSRKLKFFINQDINGSLMTLDVTHDVKELANVGRMVNGMLMVNGGNTDLVHHVLSRLYSNLKDSSGFEDLTVKLKAVNNYQTLYID